MSHVRFYRAILSHECATLSRDEVADAATVELHTVTLSREQTRLLRHFPPSQTQFQNGEIVPYLISSEHLDWWYAFILQDSLLKLDYIKNIINSHVGLVCLRDEVAACNYTVACCDLIVTR